MEVIKYEIKCNRPDIIKIYPIGDIHAGSIHCAESDIKRQVNAIAQDKKAYWIGMGDYADCIVKDDKRFQMGGLANWVVQDDITESQREWLVNLFNPIKSRCICMLTGNHEESIHDRFQSDFTKHLCKDLDIPYAGYQCFIWLRFYRGGSQSSYKIHAWHGDGAAQTEGARLMRLMRLVNEMQADIYLMGHLHAKTQHIPDRLGVDVHGKIKSAKLAATITGSWMKGYMQASPISYVERKGYKPSSMGCPVLEFEPDEHDFWVKA